MIKLHTAPATESALRLFHEGTLAFAEIERAGIRVDVDYLEKSVGDIKRSIEERKREVMGDEVWGAWRKRFGAKANPNSRQQLAEVVFRVLKLGKEEFTEKGTLRADESALESCDHPFVKKYLALMKLEKAHRTYIRGMVREVTGDYLHPFFNLNTVETYRSCVAKGTMIEIVRDLKACPKGVPIEQVKAGDYVYCFDNHRKLAIRKVLWAGKTGTKKVIRIHWNARGKHGHIDLTPEHKVRLHTGEYVEAGSLRVGDDYRASTDSKHSAKLKLLAMGRFDDKVRATYSYEVHDHRLVYEQLIGELSHDEVVHHKDGNHYNNVPSNLEKHTKSSHAKLHAPSLLTAEARARAYEARKKNLEKFGYRGPKGDDHSTTLKLSKWEVLKTLAEVSGKSARVPYTFNSFKYCAARRQVDLKVVKSRYGGDGRYISRGRLIRALENGRDSAMIELKINFYKLKNLITQRGIPITRLWANQCGAFVPHNHKVTKIEEIEGEVDVYDLEVEEFHNFIANEICVHNSSSDINFHNLPNRNKMIMGVIRRSIIPRPGNVLAEVDYGALEFKIAACKWRDDNMVSYASDDSKDIHRDQTAINYLCEPSDVSKEMRSIGKNKFVFPILYGSYYISCARDLWDAIGQFDLKLRDQTPLISHLRARGITERGELDPRVAPGKHTFVHAVKRAEDRFYEAFPTFASAKEEWWAEYLKKGYFHLMTGFVCGGQSYSRNNLMNTDIQGPGFHCLLQSIVWMQRWLRKHKFKTKIVAQIHDCILFDGPRSELQDVLDRAEYYMTVKLAREWDWLIVPMTVEVDVVEEGQTWADKKPYTKQNGLWKTK